MSLRKKATKPPELVDLGPKEGSGEVKKDKQYYVDIDKINQSIQ